MARTDLVNRLQQLFRDYETAELSGKSIEQVQSERRHVKPTRRDFLKTAAGITTAVGVAGSRGILAASQPRIAIMGGGIAGLNAALTLLDAGYASTIYEASTRTGGRVHSDTTSWENGQVSEHCGELI